MAETMRQQEGSAVRAGFFDRDAFRQEKKLILVLETGVAGLYYHLDKDSEESKNLLENLKPGTELMLFRDADNNHDKWAISVYTQDDRELGYVTRFKNETIARLMDCGKVFRAFVDERIMDTDDRRIAPTEDYRVPFSIFMEDN